MKNLIILDRKGERLSSSYFVLRGMNPNTIKAYAIHYKQFISIVGKKLDEVTTTDIQSYMQALEVMGFKPSTINTKRYGMQKIFNLLVEDGIIASNPIIELDKITPLKKKVELAKKSCLNIYDVRKVIENRDKTATGLIIKFLAMTGLRATEMINIKLTDVQDYKTTLKGISIKSLKREKPRTVYIENELYEAIRKRFNGEIFLFETRAATKNCLHKKGKQPLNRCNIYKQITLYFKKIFGAGAKVGIHQLRHFWFNYKLSVEKMSIYAVSKQGGHASYRTTMDYYVHDLLEPRNCIIAV